MLFPPDLMLRSAHLRIARATDNLPDVVRFYQEGLGFEVLGSFEDHQGFDGVMLRHADCQYHLEFTHRGGERAGRAPAFENLLVFYLPYREEWLATVERMREHGHLPIPSANPYWNRDGVTFEDPDGYRVVLQNAAWPA